MDEAVFEPVLWTVSENILYIPPSIDLNNDFNRIFDGIPLNMYTKSLPFFTYHENNEVDSTGWRMIPNINFPDSTPLKVLILWDHNYFTSETPYFAVRYEAFETPPPNCCSR